MILELSENMKAALERRVPAGVVPIWELEFHDWDVAWKAFEYYNKKEMKA